MPTFAQNSLLNYDARWLMDIVADAMLVTRADGAILLANPAAERLFGYTQSAFTQLTIEDLIPQRFRAQHINKRIVYTANSTPRTMGAEFNILGLRQDGREFAAAVSLSPLENTLVLVTVYDMTRRSQLEVEQVHLIHELQAVNAELKSFAYMVAHDLKAPLRAIGALADWLVVGQKDRLDAEGQEHLHLLIQRVRRMDTLIDGVLHYSRTGWKQGALITVDSYGQVQKVIDALAPPKHITITVAPGLPTIRAERMVLFQVFQNLIANAIRYGDKPHGVIKIDCTDHDGDWRFSVADNGPGIEVRHFERIFQLFQTLNMRDRVEGAGVGLAIVKKLIEQGGGRVWVESTLGIGSTFYFTLPKIGTATLEKVHDEDP